jgi:nardilysin
MPEEFMEHLVGLAKNKLDMFNSLSEECDCYWSEIRDRRFDWEVRRHEALKLRGFTKELALAAYDKWLLADKCRVLVVQVIGNGDGAAAFGRPHVEGSISAYIDEQVRSVHKSVGGNTWGKVY